MLRRTFVEDASMHVHAMLLQYYLLVLVGQPRIVAMLQARTCIMYEMHEEPLRCQLYKTWGKCNGRSVLHTVHRAFSTVDACCA